MENLQNLAVRANRILDEFMTNKKFVDWVRNDRSENGFYDFYITDLDSSFEIDLVCGQFKWVIVDYGYGVVYKLDFEDTGFEATRAEYEFYQHYVKCNSLEKFFGEIEFVCDYSFGINKYGTEVALSVYAMEMASIDEFRLESDTLESISHNSKKKSFNELDEESRNEVFDEIDGLNEVEVLINAFSQHYDTEELEDLKEFLENYEVNDLHSNNIGYTDRGPIIIDYQFYYV